MTILGKEHSSIFHDIDLDKLESDPRLKTFCSLPWMHLFIDNTGEHYPCCVAPETPHKNCNELGVPFHVNDCDTLNDLWNSPYMRDIRLKMLRGERPEPCTACFRAEDLGMASYRYWSNLRFANVAQKSVQLTQADGTSELTLHSFDIRLGNQCNLRCRMCYPGASKGLVEDFKRLGMMSEQDAQQHLACDWFEQPEFWDLFLRHSRDIKSLHFAGGEPFIIKQHFSFLKELVEANVAQQVELSYNTNLTILPQELLALWKHFKQVDVMVSIDGLSEVNRYIRFPSNWEQIQKNARFLHENRATYNIGLVKFNTTVQVYNIFTVTDIIDFLLEQYPDAFFLNLALLVVPDELSIQVLPAAVKQELTAKLNTYLECRRKDFLQLKSDFDIGNKLIDNIEAIVKFLNAKDESHLLPNLIQRTQIFDESRKLYCSDCVPELAAIFARYGDVNLRAS